MQPHQLCAYHVIPWKQHPICFLLSLPLSLFSLSLLSLSPLSLLSLSPPSPPLPLPPPPSLSPSLSSNFYLGAVDIFNSPTVYVTNNVFAYNGPADILKSQSFRGHSSALSIGMFTKTECFVVTKRVLMEFCMAQTMYV